MVNTMYDALGIDYDRFVNWQSRLTVELPAILKMLYETSAMHVLDAAAGTGMHAIALAQLGFEVAGVDISQGMVERARVNAASAETKVRFVQAAFGGISALFGKASFEALLCLGNSLPHLLTLSELEAALADFAACLKPGGLVLLQNRNFDHVMAKHARWMEPQGYSEGDTEWIFQRFYDFDPDGLLTFNMVILKRENKANWSQTALTSRLRPLLKDELVSSLETAGFVEVRTFGNMIGEAFNPETSPNLVVIAKTG